MKANHSGFPFLGQKLALSRWKPLALSTKLLMSLVWIGNYCRANGDWLLLFSFPFFPRPVLCVRACIWEGAGLAPRCSILPPPLNTVGRRRRRRASCYLQSPFAVSLFLSLAEHSCSRGWRRKRNKKVNQRIIRSRRTLRPFSLVFASYQTLTKTYWTFDHSTAPRPQAAFPFRFITTVFKILVIDVEDSRGRGLKCSPIPFVKM